MSDINVPPRLQDLLNLDGYLSPFQEEIKRRYREFCLALKNIEENVCFVF